MHRPFFNPVSEQKASVGTQIRFSVSARNPAAETAGVNDPALADASLTYSAENLPEGAWFDASKHTFAWTPRRMGNYTVTFTATDGVLPVSTQVTIKVR